MANIYVSKYTGKQIDTGIQGVESLQTTVDNLINGTQIVGKASSDASGNNIETTYATKQELSTKQPTGNYVTIDTEQTITATKNFGPINVVGALNIEGDIVQNGEQYETHAEQIYTADDYINMREGATSGLLQGQYSGFEIIKYNGTDNGRLVVDNTGTARVGDIGDEQPLATREETPINGGFARWNSASNSFITDINVANTVILDITSDRVVDNIITLTDEEVTKLNTLPQFLILNVTDMNINYSFSYFQSTSGIRIYLMSERFNGQNIGLELRYYISSKQLGLTDDNYKYTLVKIGGSDQDVVNFTSDPQTQLNSKYVKPTSGIPETDLSTDVQQKLNAGGGFTAEEIATLKALVSKITVGDKVTFSTTVEAPVFNDLG